MQKSTSAKHMNLNTTAIVRYRTTPHHMQDMLQMCITWCAKRGRDKMNTEQLHDHNEIQSIQIKENAKPKRKFLRRGDGIGA